MAMAWGLPHFSGPLAGCAHASERGASQRAPAGGGAVATAVAMAAGAGGAGGGASSAYTMQLKLLLLGDSAVGKTSLLMR